MRIQFYRILLLLLVTLYVAQAAIAERKFSALEPGKNFIGKKAAVLRTGSNVECSTKCHSDRLCKAYQHKVTGPGNCLLIHKNTTKEDGYTFKQDGGISIYKKVCSQASNREWNAPCGWTGPDAALYQSFDSSDGYVLTEGTVPSEMNAPLLSGWVNKAFAIDQTRRQWIDLGIHTEACMTRPETCGAAGGAISLRVNVIDCIPQCGVTSSHSTTSGFAYHIPVNNTIGVTVFLLDGAFETLFHTPAGWTNVVLNYIGPNNGEGIRMFIDGQEVDRHTGKLPYDVAVVPAGDGRITLGRIFTKADDYYATVQVDEMLLFDQSLKIKEIQLLYEGLYEEQGIN